MKDNYMTLVIKPAGLVEFPRSITINGTSYDVELVANGHVPAAFDIAEEFVNSNVEQLTERARTDEPVDDELAWANETLNQMQNHKEYGYGE